MTVYSALFPHYSNNSQIGLTSRHLTTEYQSLARHVRAARNDYFAYSLHQTTEHLKMLFAHVRESGSKFSECNVVRYVGPKGGQDAVVAYFKTPADAFLSQVFFLGLDLSDTALRPIVKEFK